MFSVSLKRSLLVTLFLALTVFILSTPVDAAASVTPSKQLYAAGEPIVVSFADFPGYTSDWITIVPVGAPNTAWGHWRYTQGGKSGSINFNGQSPKVTGSSIKAAGTVFLHGSAAFYVSF